MVDPNLTRNSYWTIVRWIFWPAIILFTLNIEKVAEALGLDTLIIRNANPVASGILDTLQSAWFQYPAVFVLGGATALYVDARLRRRERTAALQRMASHGTAMRELSKRMTTRNNSYNADRRRAPKGLSQEAIRAINDHNQTIDDVMRIDALNDFLPEINASYLVLESYGVPMRKNHMFFSSYRDIMGAAPVLSTAGALLEKGEVDKLRYLDPFELRGYDL